MACRSDRADGAVPATGDARRRTNEAREQRSTTRDDHGPRLRVGLVAPPWVPVPPPVYGGTELIIDLLARGLAAAGHEVVLFTTGDSTSPVERRWRYPQALGTTSDLVAELAHVQAAYRALADVDVIHDHTLTGPTWAELSTGVPVVTTAHGPFTEELTDLYAVAARRGASVVAISDHQRRTAADRLSSELRRLRLIDTGVSYYSFSS